ncbi:MAG: hypothetical protein KBS94_08670 [Prevotella sp.]|nr:hypothetical protein [Candidatus Equicola faecalis]
MSICIFNPWHDMALAYGQQPFTPSSFVFDFQRHMADIAEVWNDSAETDRIEPWGWDYFTKQRLIKQGYDASLMPTDEDIETLRQLSHRSTFMPLLHALRNIEGTTGESRCLDDERECTLSALRGMMMKAPWSSSGRGVRLVNSENDINWARNIIRQQGALMAEPYYNKVKDFALEFHWNGRKTEYIGSSLFTNSGYAYTGNVVASEEKKRSMLGKYVSLQTIDAICDKIKMWCDATFLPLHIPTPFGVDMMLIVEGERMLIHPCVEVNLRRTMGYVALLLYKKIISGEYNNNNHFLLTNETNENSVYHFRVSANGGKWSVSEQGMESGQW